MIGMKILSKKCIVFQGLRTILDLCHIRKNRLKETKEMSFTDY